MKFRGISSLGFLLLTLCLLAPPILNASQPPATPAPSSKDTQLNSNNDHGFWLTEDARSPLGENWSLQLHFSQRWGADYRLLWYQVYEAIFLYNITDKVQNYFDLAPDGMLKLFALGGGCSEIARIQKNTHGVFHWVWTTRPEVEVHFDLGWKGWLLRQRIRGEYQDYNSSHYKDYGDCRWRLILTSPWNFTCLKITPYINNEFFFRANTYHKSHPSGLVGGLYEDRFRVGFMANLWSDQLTTELYWQWRPLKQTPGTHPGWFYTYQWGLTLVLAF